MGLNGSKQPAAKHKLAKPGRWLVIQLLPWVFADLQV